MKDCGSYYLLDVQQGSRDWLHMRKGRITMSNMGKVVGHAPYCKLSKEDLGLVLLGKKKEEFSSEDTVRMQKGNDYEPLVRDYLAKLIKKPIYETGFAIWKKDGRFGASLDGVIDDDTGIEIKCPARMYGPIKEYMKKENKDPNDYSHIWASQYDQIVGNAVITGRKKMIFCVYAIEEKEIFHQVINIDYNYWDNFLYPTAVDFYKKYMKNK